MARYQLLVLFVAALATLGVATPAIAGDNPGRLEFDPETVDVDPGEEFEMDVTLSAGFRNEGSGVMAYNYTVVYDPELLSVEEVETGPWLERAESAEVETREEVDDEAGVVEVEHELADPKYGVDETGFAPTATLTFAVSPDAPAADALVQIADAEGTLVLYDDDSNVYDDPWVDPGDERAPLPMLYAHNDATVHVDGGGEERNPLGRDLEFDAPDVQLPDDADEPGSGDDGTGDDPANGTTSDDADDSTSDADDDEAVSDDPDDGDPVPNAPAPAVALGVLAAVGAFLNRLSTTESRDS